jgi:hypothetical protein
MDSKVLVTLSKIIQSTFILIDLVHIILETGISVDKKAFQTSYSLILVTMKLSDQLKD